MLNLNWIPFDLNFEDAMDLLEATMNLTYGVFERLDNNACIVSTGGWSKNEQVIREFNRVYSDKYCVCSFLGGSYLFTDEKSSAKNRIIALFRRGEYEEVRE